MRRKPEQIKADDELVPLLTDIARIKAALWNGFALFISVSECRKLNNTFNDTLSSPLPWFAAFIEQVESASGGHHLSEDGIKALAFVADTQNMVYGLNNAALRDKFLLFLGLPLLDATYPARRPDLKLKRTLQIGDQIGLFP